MSVPKQPQPSEADVIFNRANIALARSQRLVASWLPPRTETAKQAGESGSNEGSGKGNLEDEDDQIFTAVPERYGCSLRYPFFSSSLIHDA